MTKERIRELESIRAMLTPEECNQGYHFCNDWDGLLVGPDDKELECCTCHWEDPEMEAKMKKAKQAMKEKYK